MNQKNLSENLATYLVWKQMVVKQLNNYRTWLQSSQMDTDDIDEKLEQVKGSLQRDNITIALVGEFSRGKTEIINAIFFASYGKRLLPSRAGRTTMCPSEIFFDSNSRDSYIQLLPIETRKNSSSIRKLKQDPSLWVTIPLDLDSTDKMHETMSEVARCKSVNKEEAQLLGFSTGYLETDIEHPGHVLIPAWRHALISIDHPLLRQGLTLIDTPGLNALGSEPELTYSLLPEAHAMLFVLSADTGVTNTDLEIWRDHVKPYCHHLSNNFYAVINKMDILWDDPDDTNDQIAHISRLAAELLELPPKGILPISAKQGLIGKINNDRERIERSNIESLEALLSNHIIAKKTEALQTTVVSYILNLISISMQALQNRLDNLNEHHDTLKTGMLDHKGQFDAISQSMKEEEKAHNLAIVMIRSSQDRIKKRSTQFLAPVNPVRFELYTKKAQELLQISWTKSGIDNAIEEFFGRISEDFQRLHENFIEANRLVEEIYYHYNIDNQSNIDFTPHSINHCIIQLDEIKDRSRQSRRHYIAIFRSHKRSVEQFFDALSTEAETLYEATHQESQEWCQKALTPILKSAQARKKLITTQMTQLRAIVQDNNSAKEKLRKITDRSKILTKQITSLQAIMEELQQPINLTGQIANEGIVELNTMYQQAKKSGLIKKSSTLNR